MTSVLSSARRPSLVIAIALALFALTSLGSAPASEAAKPKVQTAPTLRFEDGFKGRLKTQARCKPKRVVKLFQEAMGPDEQRAKRTTNKRGRFDFGASVLPTDGGTFYVEVTKRTIDSAVCLKGRSQAISFAG